MSVIKSKRNIAESEFINSARALHAYTYQQCAKFPKSQTFRYGKLMVETADAILRNAQNADRIKMTTVHEAQRRLEYINLAQSACDTLDSALKEGREACGISFHHLERWAELLDAEERLLYGQTQYCYGKIAELRNRK